MTEVLEKFRLNEILAYMCPGVTLIVSFFLWYTPDFTTKFWEQEFLLVTLGLVVSYTLGWILASYNQMALVRYRRTTGIERRTPKERLWTVFQRIFFAFSSPPITRSILQANLIILEGLERLSGPIGLVEFTNPWDQPVAFRTLVADRVSDKNNALMQADNFYKRFLFSMGMAVALLILAMQCVVRIVLEILAMVHPFGIDVVSADALPSIGMVWLVVLSVAACWAAFELRHVAIRMWELERYLTATCWIAAEPDENGPKEGESKKPIRIKTASAEAAYTKRKPIAAGRRTGRASRPPPPLLELPPARLPPAFAGVGLARAAHGTG